MPDHDDKIKIEYIPIPSPSVRDWLLIEAGFSPVRYMTRQEVEERFGPEALSGQQRGDK